MLDGGDAAAGASEPKGPAIGPADKFRNATTDEWPLWGGIRESPPAPPKAPPAPLCLRKHHRSLPHNLQPVMRWCAGACAHRWPPQPVAAKKKSHTRPCDPRRMCAHSPCGMYAVGGVVVAGGVAAIVSTMLEQQEGIATI